MFLVIHNRWYRAGTQNGEFQVDAASRKREAHGLARHHFKSNLDMLIKHAIDFEDFYIDEENNEVVLADSESVCYRSKFYVVEK
jgi:hypothetical protein